MRPQTVLALLREHKALHDGHFVFTNGGHSDFYINCGVALRNARFAVQVANTMGPRFIAAKVDVVVAPAYGALPLLTPLGHFLQLNGSPETRAIMAEKDPTTDGGFVFKRGSAEELAGKRVGIAEDLWSTGGSTQRVRSTVESAGGHVVAMGAIVNRGDVTVEDIGGGVDTFFSLCSVDGVPHHPASCTLCEARVPMRTDYGHGKKWIHEHPDYPVAA